MRWGLRPQPPPTVINVGEGLVPSLGVGVGLPLAESTREAVGAAAPRPPGTQGGDEPHAVTQGGLTGSGSPPFALVSQSVGAARSLLLSPEG